MSGPSRPGESLWNHLILELKLAMACKLFIAPWWSSAVASWFLDYSDLEILFTFKHFHYYTITRNPASYDFFLPWKNDHEPLPCLLISLWTASGAGGAWRQDKAPDCLWQVQLDLDSGPGFYRRRRCSCFGTLSPHVTRSDLTPFLSWSPPAASLRSHPLLLGGRIGGHSIFDSSLLFLSLFSNQNT